MRDAQHTLSCSGLIGGMAKPGPATVSGTLKVFLRVLISLVVATGLEADVPLLVALVSVALLVGSCCAQRL